MLAVRHPYRRITAGCANCPDGGFVARAPLIYVDAGERDSRSVGGELRVGNPNEVKEIFFGDGTRTGSRWRRGILCSERSNNCEADDHNSKPEFHTYSRCRNGSKREIVPLEALVVNPTGGSEETSASTPIVKLIEPGRYREA